MKGGRDKNGKIGASIDMIKPSSSTAGWDLRSLIQSADYLD